MLRRLPICLILATAAFAADPFYIGTWKITSAVPAPWANADYQPDKAEMKALLGKTIIIKAAQILGPRQAACRNPKYEVKDYPADMLFQGMFGEMHERDHSIDPAKMAEKVGFHGKSWKTLETGCETELDFHFPDAATAEFGLNNVVYIMKKQ